MCRAPVGRRSEANAHGASSLRHANRRPRLPRRRSRQGDRARHRARLRARSRSSTSRRGRGGRRRTATRTSPRSARRCASAESSAVLIHAVYLLNCASEDAEIRAKSLDVADARRCASATRSAPHGVVLHPGSALKGERRAGDRPRRRGRSREALAESERCPLHLENTAGAGGTLGRIVRASSPRCSTPAAAASASASAWTPATCSRPATTSARRRASTTVLDEFDAERRPRAASARCTSTTRRRRSAPTATATRTSARASSARRAAPRSCPSRASPGCRACWRRRAPTAAARRPTRSL